MVLAYIEAQEDTHMQNIYAHMMANVKCLKNVFSVVLLLLLGTSHAFAWYVVDQKDNRVLEIAKEDIVITGNDLTLFDADRNVKQIVRIESITKDGDVIEFEVYDEFTGRRQTLTMVD